MIQRDAYSRFISEKSKAIYAVVIGAVVGTAMILLVFVSFGLGILVGAQKARFSYAWADNYHRLFGGPVEGLMRSAVEAEDFLVGHGDTGRIIKIENEKITIKSGKNIEKSILISNDTAIRKGSSKIKATDLESGDLVVVLGNPNSKGQIEAKLIRVFELGK